MMDINKVGVSNTVPTVPQQLSGQSVDKGSTGVYATIDNLIAMLQKMNIDIRDMGAISMPLASSGQRLSS